MGKINDFFYRNVRDKDNDSSTSEKKERKKTMTKEELEDKVTSMSLSQLNKDEPQKKITKITPVHVVITGVVFLSTFYLLTLISAHIAQKGLPYKIMVPKGPGAFVFLAKLNSMLFLLSMLISLGLSIFILQKLVAPKEHDEDRMSILKVGVLGSTNWMSHDEIISRFNLCPTDDLDGIPIGVRYNQAICIPWEPKSLKTTLPNNNILVTGPAGTRKSRGLIIPHSIQYIRKGRSLIVTDTKGDLYRKLAPIAMHYGYNVKKFICQAERFKYSDGWDCLKGVRESSDPLSAASMFADVVITNTEHPQGRDPQYWRNLDGNLLEALVLYVARSAQWVPVTNRKEAKRDLKEVYALLSVGADVVVQIFENIKIIDNTDLCLGAYGRWVKNAQAEQGYSNLATRLRILQNDYISGMLSADDIDITAAGDEKCVYFVIMDDQVSTYNFISSLFFSFAFYELVKKADEADQVLDVPVQFMLDEFANCGTIPDFTRKISTVRSRGIGITICIQGLNQLRLLYPNNEWENILNNCAVQIILGSFENTTAKYYSDNIGDCTVEAENIAREMPTFSLYRPLGVSRTVKVTKSMIKRKLMNPEEIIGMEADRQIVKIAGTTKILEEHKYDLDMHPDSRITANIKPTEGTPEWVITDGLAEIDEDGVVHDKYRPNITVKDTQKKQGIAAMPPSNTGIGSILSVAKSEEDEEYISITGLNDFANDDVSTVIEDDTNDRLNAIYFNDELTDDFTEEFDDDTGLL